MLAESGREIEIIAGLRRGSATDMTCSSSVALFDVIEHVQQQTIMTPLYAIVPPFMV